MPSKLDAYFLQDIVEAQANGVFTLPTVQRGFVWKPHQIENLWDSLLRGYPVGSIVLSENDNKTFEILDGQQRLSSICLGISTANSNSTVFKTSHNYIRIFIDLGKPDIDDNRKYIFRVITRSHPWGYQRNDNKKPLESKDKRKFRKKFGTLENLFNENLKKFYPFDAKQPVPFEIFMNSSTEVDAENESKKWITKYWQGGKSKDGQEIQSQEIYTAKEIFEAVKLMKEKTKIPALYLNLPHIINNQESNDEQKNGQDEDNENTRLDEIENMFVRLNAGGTPLTGEELNYSILKAHLASKTQNKTQKLIEQSCGELFRPARFITLAYRLWSMKGKKERNFYRLGVKPKNFQNNMKDKKKRIAFVTFIKSLCEGGKKEPSLLENIKNILIYNEKNKQGLPFLVVSRLSAQAPEVIYMIMFRLQIKGDCFAVGKYKIGSDVHKKMLGIVTLFSWLGKGEQKDHSQLLRNIFPAMVSLDQERFWSWETVQRASLPYNDKDVLTPFPSSDELSEKLEWMIGADNRGKKKRRDGVGESLKPFTEKIFFDKSLILYAQREYLSNKYENKVFSLDDTNVPFDWDHIFPHDFIRHKRGISQSLKDWYHSNGNFWACPYELNRKFQDDAPCEKFKNIFCDKIKDGVSIEDVFLEQNDMKAFQGIESAESLKEKDNLKKAYDFILRRNLRLCEEWYVELLIDELSPYNGIDQWGESESQLSKYLDNRKFIEADHAAEDFIEYKRNISECLSMYIYFDRTESFIEEGVEFGLCENNGSTLSEIKETDEYKKLEDGEDSYLYKLFTLTSDDERSYRDLLKEIRAWLNELPITINKKKLVDVFVESLNNNGSALLK